MGNITGPNLDNLVKEYVAKVPVLPEGVATGEEVAKDQHEANQLWYLANQVNLKVQKNFELAH